MELTIGDHLGISDFIDKAQGVVLNGLKPVESGERTCVEGDAGVGNGGNDEGLD